MDHGSNELSLEFPGLVQSLEQRGFRIPFSEDHSVFQGITNQ